MKEKEKCLELAKLMGWTEFKSTGPYLIFSEYELSELKPYCHDTQGLAQFGAIILKFPEVFEYASGGGFIQCKDVYIRPTQESILDGILIMKGVTI